MTIPNKPAWLHRLDNDLIAELARFHGLEPELVYAVVQTESTGNTWTVKHEPQYIYTLQIPETAKALGTDAPTVEVMQKTSFGLMQVMYAVAIEHGFRGWPTELCNPRIGLTYGCIHLAAKKKTFGPDPERIYAAYNAGRVRKKPDGTFTNQKHVDRFMAYYKELTVNG